MRQIAHGGDPFETGSARPLDYGHWSAHKLETLTNHHLRHGEAVAIGIALDARYSVLAGLLAAGQEARICALLEHLGFRLWHPALEATRPDGSLAVFDGPARVPRASRRRADGHAARRHRPRRRGARDRRGADACRARLAQGARGDAMKLDGSGAARAPHLLHQHPPRRDLAGGGGEPRAAPARGEAPGRARPAVRRRAPARRRRGRGACARRPRSRS